eukprot:TRINITY_DN8257_c1_g1_i1.p1 TRINITY_DN8257_c1_g1~~TRINITY_DN8257_c1_g1_i1.p1  ORF type:complete len:2042 (-),score=374.10 TRINITY_DN8257_c1_g1_i1:129-5954(-)
MDMDTPNSSDLPPPPPPTSQPSPPPAAAVTSSGNNRITRSQPQVEDGTEDEDGSEASEEDEEGEEEELRQPKIAVEIVLGRRRYEGEEEFLVKFANQSYLRATWYTRAALRAIGAGVKVDNWIRKHGAYDPEEEEREYFNPAYTEVDRIVASRGAGGNGTPMQYLVKWRALSYDDCTWELVEEMEQLAPQKVARFKEAQQPPPAGRSKPRPSPQEFMQSIREELAKRVYKNGNTLRDYQIEGLLWMAYSWVQGRSVILADEMGLGKTLQVLTFLDFLRRSGRREPFLVVAPLSTLGNWQREVETWTDLNCVMYHGTQQARDMIYALEFFYIDARTGHPRNTSTPKFDILLTTYELVSKEAERFAAFTFETAVIDEGHRMKNSESHLFQSLIALHTNHRIVLTGTPIQNQIGELFTLLHFIDPCGFPSKEEFLEQFGNIHEQETLQRLHQRLELYVKRRTKEDVETSIPPKTETLVKVRLTRAQKMHYKAVLENNREFLCKGIRNRSNVPRLVNIMMQLRKICNHPFLMSGAEERITAGMTWEQRQDQIIAASSKMVFLDKLLRRLRQEGRRVLVFSQMTKMLDILQAYVSNLGYPHERLDGNVGGMLRQQAIDRFCNLSQDGFVFLLSTKAGGVGINLTAADTVVIFDSDWNPQNDVQAQSRVHRIGQTSDVKVYRLITERTYEERMFEVASKKLGLDRAVLAGKVDASDGSGHVNEKTGLTFEQIDILLKKGAYELYAEGDEEINLQDEDLDRILQRATVVNVAQQGIQGLAGFNKAVFNDVHDNSRDVELTDEQFWDKILPERISPGNLMRRLTENGGLTEENREAFLSDVHTLAQRAIEFQQDVSQLTQAQQAEVYHTTQLLAQLEASATVFQAQERSEFAELRKKLEMPRARKGLTVDRMEGRNARNTAPSADCWMLPAVQAFTERFALAGWGAWDRLHAELRYSSPIDHEQLLAVSEALCELSHASADKISSYCGPYGGQPQSTVYPFTLLSFALRETDRRIATQLRRFLPTPTCKFTMQVSYAALQDIKRGSEDEVEHGGPGRVWFGTAPSDVPLCGQALTVSLSTEESPPPNVRACLLMTYAPPVELLEQLELPHMPRLRCILLEPGQRQAVINVPGYAGTYDLRCAACFVAKSETDKHGQGGEEDPEAAEAVRKMAEAGEMETIEVDLANGPDFSNAASYTFVAKSRTAMDDEEVSDCLVAGLLARSPVHTAALNAVGRRFGPGLVNIGDVISEHIAQQPETGPMRVPDISLSWWEPATHDALLLRGLLRHGMTGHYSKVLRDPNYFGFSAGDVRVNKAIKLMLDARVYGLLRVFCRTFREVDAIRADREPRKPEKPTPADKAAARAAAAAAAGPTAAAVAKLKSHTRTIKRAILLHGLCYTLKPKKPAEDTIGPTDGVKQESVPMTEPQPEAECRDSNATATAEPTPDWERLKATDPALEHVQAEILGQFVEQTFPTACATPHDIFLSLITPSESNRTPSAIDDDDLDGGLKEARPARRRGRPSATAGDDMPGEADAEAEGSAGVDKLSSLGLSVDLMRCFDLYVRPVLPPDDPSGLEPEAVPEPIIKWFQLTQLATSQHWDKIAPPRYWRALHDLELLRGVRKHGLDFRRIQADPALVFRKIRESAAQGRAMRKVGHGKKTKQDGEAEEPPEAAAPEPDAGASNKLLPIFTSYIRVMTYRLAYLCAAAKGHLAHLESQIVFLRKEEEEEEGGKCRAKGTKNGGEEETPDAPDAPSLDGAPLSPGALPAHPAKPKPRSGGATGGRGKRKQTTEAAGGELGGEGRKRQRKTPAPVPTQAESPSPGRGPGTPPPNSMDAMYASLWYSAYAVQAQHHSQSVPVGWPGATPASASASAAPAMPSTGGGMSSSFSAVGLTPETYYSLLASAQQGDPKAVAYLYSLQAAAAAASSGMHQNVQSQAYPSAPVQPKPRHN